MTKKTPFNQIDEIWKKKKKLMMTYIIL